MLRNILGLINTGFSINKNSRLINDDKPSYQIQKFASQVLEAFRISQIEEKTDEEKKVSFFTNFDKILKSTGLKSNEKLKDEIYNDLISNAESHLRRINIIERPVRVRTAPYLQDNETDNKIDSIQIRLLIYDLRHRSEQQTEGSPSSFRLGWAELLPILTPEIRTYLQFLNQINSLGRRDIGTQNLFFQLPPAAEFVTPPEAIYASNIKPDKVDEFKKFLKTINPYCDPDEAKIEKVLEEYKIYKKQVSDSADSRTKPDKEVALKQAIDDALKTYTLPQQISDHLQEIDDVLIKNGSTPIIDFAPLSSINITLRTQINLALNSQSTESPNPGSGGIEINLLPWEDQPSESESKSISHDVLKSILFQNEVIDENKVQIKTPNTKLESLDDFKKFLAENGGTNLDERSVNAAFEAYETYYKEALSQQNYELLQRLQKGTTTKISDDEFEKIVSFLDRMPEAELNASLVTQLSIKLLADESETPAQSITVADNKRDKVVDIKRDKVAEFKKFLNEIDLDFQITKDNYDEILSQYYKYKKCEEEFMTRKSYNLNLDLISELTKSEKNLKNTISSCLHLSEKTKLPTISKDEPSNEPKPYKINDKDFDKVLNYLKYEQIKNHDEQNPPPKNNYGPPKPNNILDDLVKSIGEIPSNILRVFNSIRTFESSPREKDPSSTRE
jgi:hypothetical protein